jgi:hypothetical protein
MSNAEENSHLGLCARERKRGRGIVLVVGTRSTQVGGKQISMAKMPMYLAPAAAIAATPEASRQLKQANAQLAD